MLTIIVIIVVSILALGFGSMIGYFFRKNVVDAKIKELANANEKIATAEKMADKIKTQAEKDAEGIKKETKIKAKEEAYNIKEEAEKEIKLSKVEIQKKEQRLNKKEESIDKKIDKLENKEKDLELKFEKLEEKEEAIDEVKAKQDKELERISNLTKNEAKDLLLTKLKDEIIHDSALIIKEFENKLKEDQDRISKRILSTAISKASSDYVVDATISVVQLPNDEMKGRIIGREGRNIRAIEALTGVDVIIDDTPEAVVISSFDSVKREIARVAISKLVADGRIHPAKIEESVQKATEEVEASIVEAGEQALLELGIPGMAQEVVRTLGRLKYRTSYGQNVLVHSIEVAYLAASLAAEIGGDVELAKRSGLLHDIGKALDHDVEGSHALIGADFLKKFKERPQVINAVGAHHNELEFETVEAILVQASDAISASRPGARRETLTTYLKRLEGLEKIANSQDGVETSFAIQAGREIRIIVKPEDVSDEKSITLSRDVAKEVEKTMQYPGQIKVTVVRETRAVEYAK